MTDRDLSHSAQARRSAGQAYDRFVAAGSNFAKVATDDEIARPLQTLDSRGWLPTRVAGWDVLCLAAAGGWQSMLYAAAGARVTVVDVSTAMLSLDDREARRRGYSVRLIEASMDNMPMLGEATFDLVHQPVSTCYVPNIELVYREIARVLRDGGLYISQHKQPTSAQVTRRTAENDYVLGLEYYRSGPLPEVEDRAYRERGTVEYLHRWEQLVGGLCRAGLVLEDLTEPYRADPNEPPGRQGHRGRFIPPYVRLKARRLGRDDEGRRRGGLWVPG